MLELTNSKIVNVSRFTYMMISMHMRHIDRLDFANYFTCFGSIKSKYLTTRSFTSIQQYARIWPEIYRLNSKIPWARQILRNSWIIFLGNECCTHVVCTRIELTFRVLFGMHEPVPRKTIFGYWLCRSTATVSERLSRIFSNASVKPSISAVSLRYSEGFTFTSLLRSIFFGGRRWYNVIGAAFSSLEQLVSLSCWFSSGSLSFLFFGMHSGFSLVGAGSL